VPYGLERLAEARSAGYLVLVEGESDCWTLWKQHAKVHLVVIDTWAKIAPPSGMRRSTQYEGDYEAQTPLKRLADTYHVSILAVHHLRKTGASDVLDEVTGSTGLTRAVDGALILKRERGQMEASIYVTGRDVECEQQLALAFEPITALWTLTGNAEEVKRSRERQQVLDLLKEQLPEGMKPYEIAAALDKNYHTTRSLLRKTEEAGEVSQLHTYYFAVSSECDKTPGRSQPLNSQEERRIFHPSPLNRSGIRNNRLVGKNA
jgi:hypothetical protein